MVNLSLDIPQETYELLSKFSEHFKKDVSDIALDCISVPSLYFPHITRLYDEYIAPYALESVLNHIMGSGIYSIDSVFNKLLELLDAKGRFIQSDLEIDLEEFRLWINYAGLVGSDFLISSFDVTLESNNVRLSANSILSPDEVSEDTVEKLRNLIEDKGFDEIVIPEKFYETEYEVDFIVDDYSTLQIDISSESLSYLPTIPTIDSLIQNIYEKVGVN